MPPAVRPVGQVPAFPPGTPSPWELWLDARRQRWLKVGWQREAERLQLWREALCPLRRRETWLELG